MAGPRSGGAPVQSRLAVLGAALLALVGLAGIAGCGTTSDRPELAADDVSFEPATATPAPTVDLPPPPSFVATATATDLSDGAEGGEVEVFASTEDAEPSWTIANPVDGDGTPVAPVVFLLAGDRYDANADWLEVNLPVRPNGTTGWVRAADVEVSTHEFHIEVDLDAHQLTVTEGLDVVLEAPAGVGTGETPTPGGTFYTRSLIRSTNAAYGPYAYGLSGFSEVHESFGSGPGDLGIHGTDDPSAVGEDVSNGCIRLHNDDIERLAELLPLGVPVEITA